jgi:hypothetical protein
MSQTSIIFFGLIVGFIVFITVRGELSAYLNVLGISGSTFGGIGGAVSSGTGSTGRGRPAYGGGTFMDQLCRIEPAACASIGGNPVSAY